MNRPVLTGVPPRVTSVTSTTPRDVVTSIRRPARVASMMNRSTPCPVSTTASTRSPFIARIVLPGWEPRLRAHGGVRVTPRRSQAPLVLAIDVGSSSVRATLYDAAGRPRRGAFARVRYAPDVDGRGTVSVPVERLIAALDEAIEGLVARAAADLPRVQGIGMSCFLHSAAALDRAGRPISPLLTWADTTSAPAAADLRAGVDAARLWGETGAPIHASYWPAKIVRLRTLAGARVQAFAGAPELLWRHLTGEWGVDLSLASGTGLLDRASGAWHEALLGALDLPAAALPGIRPPGAAAPVAGPAAARWPALAGRPCFAPWSDAWCGNLGLGAASGGPAALQVGTSGAVRVVAGDPVPSLPRGLFAHRLPDGTALVGGQLSEGGGVAAAVATLLGGSPRTFEHLAAALPPDGHGLTVLPFLAGERGPGYHAEARGTVTGLSLATRPEELYLATVESIALRFAELDERLSGAIGRQPDVVASGGALARSSLLPQLIAAALGRPIRLSAEGEASARGAALLALAALGVVDGPAGVQPPPSTTIEPETARVAAYRRARERQGEFYAAIFGGG